jgi:hypothetical protein
MKQITTILFILTLLNELVFCQSDSLPPIGTDRPTQSTSPYFVPRGSFQIETGAIFTSRNDDINEKQLMSLGNTSLRYGIFENFEVNVASSYESITVHPIESGNDSTISGMGPVSAGFKVFVCEEKGLRPQIAIVGIINFRHIGNENFTPTFSYPLGKLVATHNLSDHWSLGYNIGFSLSGETADGFFVYSGYIGYLITNRLWSFVEAYGNFDNGNFPNHRGDAGLTYRLTNNLQVDLSGGMGFDKDVQRNFISAGISWRIPQ